MNERGGALAQTLVDKADAALLRALRTADLDSEYAWPVMLVIEHIDLTSPGGRARAAQSFEMIVQSTIAALRSHGVTEVRPDWLARSLVARATLTTLEAAAALPEVVQIVLDTPRLVMASPRRAK